MKNKQIKETMDFLGMLGVSFNKENEKTFERWLDMILDVSYKVGKADGIERAREIYSEKTNT